MLGDPLVEDLLLSSTEDGEKLRKKIRRSEKQEQGQNRIFKKTWIITGTTRKHRNPLTKVKVLQKTKLCPKCPGRSESNNVSYYETNKYQVVNISPCVHNQIILVAQWRQRIIDEGDHYCTSDTTRLLSHLDLTHLCQHARFVQYHNTVLYKGYKLSLPCHQALSLMAISFIYLSSEYGTDCWESSVTPVSPNHNKHWTKPANMTARNLH